MGTAIAIISALFAIAAIVAIALWHKILKWAEQSLFPWLKDNLPSYFEEFVKKLFVALDKVAVSIRLAVKKAWEKVRPFLRDATIRFERTVKNTWVKRWTVKIIKITEQKPSVKIIESEEEIDFDDLPAEVQEQWLHLQQESYEVGFADIRDKEIEELVA